MLVGCMLDDVAAGTVEASRVGASADRALVATTTKPGQTE